MNRNSKIFIQENGIENVICKMVGILFRGRWVQSGQVCSSRFALFLNTPSCPGVGITKPIFSVPSFSQFFRMIKTVVICMILSSYLAGVTHRSSAAVTPGKCEHDWNYLTYTFAKSKFPVTEKLPNGALVTPPPAPHKALCVSWGCPVYLLWWSQCVSIMEHVLHDRWWDVVLPDIHRTCPGSVLRCHLVLSK